MYRRRAHNFQNIPRSYNFSNTLNNLHILIPKTTNNLHFFNPTNYPTKHPAVDPTIHPINLVDEILAAWFEMQDAALMYASIGWKLTVADDASENSPRKCRIRHFASRIVVPLYRGTIVLVH